MLSIIVFTLPVYVLDSAAFTFFMVAAVVFVAFWVWKFVASLLVGG